MTPSSKTERDRLAQVFGTDALALLRQVMGQTNYALRAGVEGTIDQALDVTGMRRARYRGLPKVRLQHVFSAITDNIVRLDAYWSGHLLDRNRTSRLARLSHQLTG